MVEPIVNVSLSPRIAGPLYRRLFETLREAIVAGTLPSGSRLPATRELAEQLAVSRNTVNTAYDMLHAEGYAMRRRGSGFYVTADLPDQPLAALPPGPSVPARHTAFSELSQRGRILAEASRPVPDIEGPAFQRGLPALDQFPFSLWQQHLARHCRRPDPQLLKYRDDGGLPALRSALKDYLQLARGVRCETQQIIIVAGGQAGLDLLSRLLVDAGDKVAIEDPGYIGARDALRAAGASLVPTPVDQDGLCVETLGSGPRLVYVTPSYQFPLGMTLSAARRLQLLHWAAQHDAHIIEDDYDSEFRFGGKPLSSMQGIDGEQRVAYMGTFSKVMFPALRLGYLVVPPALARACAAALRKTGQDAPLLIQAAMADFMRSGQFAAHIRRMRKCYARRQALLVELAQRHLSGLLDVQPTHAGMQLAGYFTRQMNEARLLALARGRGLDIACLSAYSLEECRRPGIFLGYAGVPESIMESAVIALGEALAGARA